MDSDFDYADAAQAELLGLTTHLAAEISRTPAERDAAAVLSLWEKIETKRSRLQSAYRKIRKYERSGRGGEKGRQALDEQRRMRKRVTQLRQRMAMWGDMRILVHRHAAPAATSLDTPRDGASADPVVTMLHRALHRLANPNNQTEAADEYGCFADIPMPIHRFELLMMAAYRVLVAQGRMQGTRFLDVGAGGGTKCFVASHYFTRCDGLEYDPAYAAAGARTMELIAPETCHVFEGDGLTFDGYGDYDVIYFYRPMRDPDLLEQLETRIMNEARPGALIVAPYDAFGNARGGLEGSRVTEPIFLAHASQGEADALRHAAERTGCDIVKRARDYAFDTGFWAPVLDAAGFNP
ncbi:MAG: class I SAM-dependent methyltransferase [Pseudooceanicola sp.]